MNISGQNPNNGIFYAFISRCLVGNSWQDPNASLFMLQNAKNVQVAKTNNDLSDLTLLLLFLDYSRLFVCNQATVQPKINSEYSNCLVLEISLLNSSLFTNVFMCTHSYIIPNSRLLCMFYTCLYFLIYLFVDNSTVMDFFEFLYLFFLTSVFELIYKFHCKKIYQLQFNQQL